MAASNVTIDDTSSLLVYEPAGAWSHASGRDAQSYGNSTFSSAQTEGATAKFLFTGTGFWVYGATKPEYGQYILLLDSQVMLYANATSNEPQFGQVLGGSSGLADGKHEVVLMAAGGGLVDIDAIVYETTDQRQGSISPAGTQTMSASSRSQSVPRLSATPNSKTDGSDDTASDQASSSSSTAAASAADAASPISGQPDATQSTAQPNTQASAQPGDQSSQGNPQTSPQATAQPSARPNASAGAAATSSATPSSSQPHGATTDNYLSPTISQAQSAGSPPIAGTTQAQRGLPMGAIIGIAIGAVIGLLLLVALFFLLLRRRRAKARRHANVLPSPVLPLQNPDTQGGYFFGGYAGSQGANPMRELYLRTSPAMPQAPGPVHAGRRSGVELLPASTFRDSSGSYADTATLVSEGGTDMSMKMVPTRPPRPPELHLDV
ncbi:hypothetical protein OH76DRAFT_145765 [Lentinus brumalis]|uniref:Uncharacterized protein n=1 Tax=Lentinus brumalis TaxID=2498619 RepID=A0A371CP79_9APHY|nr:hypothetical protein OH76DRAFT_145765 [Polyporus brumalis]